MFPVGQVKSLGYRLPSPFLLKALSQEIRAFQPDIIHSHLEFSNLVTSIVTRHYNLPFVIHDHSGTVNNDARGYRLRRKAAARLIRSDGRIMAISKAVKQFNVDELDIPASRVSLVYNGIDIDAYASRAITGRFGGRNGEVGGPVVGFVGRLHSQKGVEYLLQSLPGVFQRVPRAKAVIVGDGPLRRTLEACVDASNLRCRVRFVGSTTEAATWYPRFDLVVQPSVFEPLGLVAVEAMASAVPVVAFAVDGLSEVVLDKKTGFLVERGNVAELEQAIVMILENPDLGRSMGLAGQVRAREMFSDSRMVRECHDVYRMMIGAK